MKKIFFLSILISTVATANAQAVEFIEPRNVQVIADGEFTTYTAGSNYYILQKKYRMMAPVMYDLQLDAYDANRKPIGSNGIDKALEMGDANLYEGVYPLKDKLVMFKSEFSKASGSKMSLIYCYPFDETGRRQKKTLLTSFPAESAFNSGNFSVNVSPDGTKIAVISEWPYEKEGMEKCTVTVFDDQLKQVWKKDYTFTYESSKAPKNTIFVNNAGNVFILKQINLKKAFDQFSFFTFLNDNKTVVEKKVDLGNGFRISSYKEFFKSNGDLVLAGYSYMDKKVGVNVETPDGMFYIDVNASSGEFNTAKLTTMSPTTVTATQLLPLADNSLCLVGERRSVGSTSIPGKPFEYNYNYTSSAFSLTKIGTDGSEVWTYKYQRDFRSTNDGGRMGTGYAWVNGNNINLLFGDEWSRHDDKKQFITFGSTRVNVIQTIGADGKFISESVVMDPRIGGKKGEYLFIPSTASVYKDHKLFLLSARGQELVGTTLTY